MASIVRQSLDDYNSAQISS